MFPSVLTTSNNRNFGTLRVAAQRYERTIGALIRVPCSVIRVL
jgi:hypothetical protein